MASEKRTRKAVPSPPVSSSPPFLERALPAIEKRAHLIAIVLVLIATVRIAATYSVFSHTNDEPAHIACGMEWLDKHVYRYEVQHPPLARIAAALGPWLKGRHSVGKTGPLGMHFEGLEILYQGDRYDDTLWWARVGVLPFFWLAALVVYLWARKDFGGATAVVALFLFTFAPPILAHAGLATTDMAVSGCLGAAFLAGRVWLERPTLRSGAVFGLCGGLALLSKFSSIPYFAAAAVLTIAAYGAAGRLRFDGLGRLVRERLPSLALAAVVASILVAAIYRGHVGDFFQGVMAVVQHNREGHLSYLLGQVSTQGFHSFYFVVLAYKTPIALLVLAALGLALVKARWKSEQAWMIPAAYSIATLAVALFSHINIGVRHILPIYTGMSILAAGGVLWLARNPRRIRWAPAAVAALLAWYAGASIVSHPDYLPYFNEFAGGHPETILVDSDLDWGQDMKRLLRRLRGERASSFALSSNYFVFQRPNMPTIRQASGETPFVGWNAVSLSSWKQVRFGHQDRDPQLTFWPDRYPPQEIIGKSIYLWYFPPTR